MRADVGDLRANGLDCPMPGCGPAGESAWSPATAIHQAAAGRPGVACRPGPGWFRWPQRSGITLSPSAGGSGSWPARPSAAKSCHPGQAVLRGRACPPGWPV